MDDLDEDKILEALHGDEDGGTPGPQGGAGESSRAAGPPAPSIDSIQRVLAESFRASERSLSILAWAKMGLAMTIAVVMAVMFFVSDTAQEWIGYATGFGVSYIGVGLIWTFYWLVLNRNVTVREIKRLELKIDRIASRLPGA